MTKLTSSQTPAHTALEELIAWSQQPHLTDSQRRERLLTGLARSQDSICWSAGLSTEPQISAGMAALCGVAPGQAVRWQTLHDMIHPEDLDVILLGSQAQPIVDVATRPCVLRYRIILPGGELRWRSCHSVLLRDSSTLALCIDETNSSMASWDRKIQDWGHSAHRNHSTNLKFFCEISPFSALIVSVSRPRVLWVNAALETRLARHSEQLLNSAASAVFAEPTAFNALTRAVVAEGRVTGHFAWLHASGSGVSPALLSACAVQYRGEVAVLILCQDASALSSSQVDMPWLNSGTLQKRVRDRLSEQLVLVSQLLTFQATGASAAVTNGLARALARIEIMSFLGDSDERSSGGTPIDLSEYLSRVAVSATAAGKPQGVRLELELDEVNVNVDEAKACAGIVHELVCNAALHAFPDEASTGQISVTCKRRVDRIVLEVEDTGCGCAREKLVESNGLGLPIVQSIAESLSGTLVYRAQPSVAIRLEFDLTVADHAQG